MPVLTLDAVTTKHIVIIVVFYQRRDVSESLRGGIGCGVDWHRSSSGKDTIVQTQSTHTFPVFKTIQQFDISLVITMTGLVIYNSNRDTVIIGHPKSLTTQQPNLFYY